MSDLSTLSLVGLATSVMRLCVWLVLLAAIFVPVERLFALRPEKVFRKAVWADLGFYFLSSLVPGLVLGFPMAMIAIAGHRVVPWAFQDAVAHAPLWVRMVAGLLIGEVGAYWGHRLSHHVPFLWRFHAVHHEAEHMDWLVNTRTHPVDMVFTRLCTLTPLFILGLGGPSSDAEGSLVPALVLVIGAAWGFFVHANVRWRFGVLEHLVATPAFHHWHHTLEGPINRNFSSMLPWLDKVFGTFHLPRREWPAEYGVSEPMDEAAAVVDGAVGSRPMTRA